MQIGFDISALDPAFKNHSGRGIGRYVAELHHRLNGDEFFDFQLRFFDHQSIESFPWADKVIELAPYGKQTLRQQLLYPTRLRRGVLKNCDAIHFPAHMDAPSWCGVPILITVLDLIPLMFKDLYQADRADWRFKLARWLEIRAIKNASFIFTISECVAQDVQRILNIPADRIRVTPLGVDRKFFVGTERSKDPQLWARLGLNRAASQLLYVGGIDQRKNVLGLLRSFRHVINDFSSRGVITPQLVLAGRIDKDKQYPVLLEKISELGLQDAVVLPGFVSDEDLLRLYAGVDLFVFPSLYEGFGLPPLEALAAGIPVVSSNTSAMPEVLGDAARLVDPNDPEIFAGAILDVLNDPDQMRWLRERGPERARLFSWERTARETVEGYHQFFEHKHHSSPDWRGETLEGLSNRETDAL